MRIKSRTDLKPDVRETSLILFCANYKKEKLEKVRQRYRDRNCLKCVKKAISKTKKSHSSTPVVKLKSDAAKRSGVQTNQELFYTTLSPISQRHNTLERMRRENIVRRNLLEKSLEAIIAEARRDLLRSQDTASSLGSEATVEERAEATDYVNMNPSSNNNGNNNSKLVKNNNLDVSEDYVEDEVYEDVLFQQKSNENFYEPVNFNAYEPINFK